MGNKNFNQLAYFLVFQRFEEIMYGQINLNFEDSHHSITVAQFYKMFKAMCINND